MHGHVSAMSVLLSLDSKHFTVFCIFFVFKIEYWWLKEYQHWICLELKFDRQKNNTFSSEMFICSYKLHSVYSLIIMLINTWATSWRKPDFCICKNKGTNQMCSTAQLISAFVFPSWIIQSLFFFRADISRFFLFSKFLWLYNIVCVGPGGKFILLSGIFFGCLRGRNKAPFPMRFRWFFFPIWRKKIPITVENNFH